jgi:hypothetical protein
VIGVDVDEIVTARRQIERVEHLRRHVALHLGGDEGLVGRSRHDRSVDARETARSQQEVERQRLDVRRVCRGGRGPPR